MEPCYMQMCDKKGMDGNRVLENVFQRHLKPQECFHLRSALLQSLWVRRLTLQTMNSESCSFRAGMCRLRGRFWREIVAWHRECPCGWALKQLSSGESAEYIRRVLFPGFWNYVKQSLGTKSQKNGWEWETRVFVNTTQCNSKQWEFHFYWK